MIFQPSEIVRRGTLHCVGALLGAVLAAGVETTRADERDPLFAPAGPAGAVPSSAAAQVVAQRGSRAEIADLPIQQAPAANVRAAEPAAPAADRGIIGVGGNDGAGARAAPAATSTAGSQAGSTPIQPNRGPAPQRGTLVAPRGAPQVIPRPTRPLSTGGARAAARGETRLETSPLAESVPAARAAGDLEVRTEDLICRGGPGFRFESHGQDARTGLSLVRLYFSLPSRNAANRYPAAGADGLWLDPGTCAFSSREWAAGDPPAVQFQTRTGDPQRDVLQMRHGSDSSAATSPNSRSIPAYLQDDGHYWRFSVYKTAYGFHHAVSHALWQPAASGYGRLDEWRTPEHGGRRGAPFAASCDVGSYVVGIQTRVGDDIDAIAPICARLRPDGSRGVIEWLPPNGGSGGTSRHLTCPEQEPFVRQIGIMAEGEATTALNAVAVRCGPARGPLAPEMPGFNALSVAGPEIPYDRPLFGSFGAREWIPLECPDGFAFSGLHGNADWLVGGLGAICRELP